jgi:hypothetical protein
MSFNVIWMALSVTCRKMRRRVLALWFALTVLEVCLLLALEHQLFSADDAEFGYRILNAAFLFATLLLISWNGFSALTGRQPKTGMDCQSLQNHEDVVSRFEDIIRSLEQSNTKVTRRREYDNIIPRGLNFAEGSQQPRPALQHGGRRRPHHTRRSAGLPPLSRVEVPQHHDQEMHQRRARRTSARISDQQRGRRASYKLSRYAIEPLIYSSDAEVENGSSTALIMHQGCDEALAGQAQFFDAVSSFEVPLRGDRGLPCEKRHIKRKRRTEDAEPAADTSTSYKPKDGDATTKRRKQQEK